MGLDMYAYSAAKANAKNDYYNAKYELGQDNATDPTTELAYWRKHPNLHGWMEQLWTKKTQPDPQADPMFNGVELELTFDDILQLEQDIVDGNLPHTTGFFFGDDSDEHYREQDLAFVRRAKADLFMGLRVFYNSSW
jgi:hypothetical protein